MKLTTQERIQPNRQSESCDDRAEMARHARLELLLTDGRAGPAVHEERDCCHRYISRWIKRHESDRQMGLPALYGGRARCSHVHAVCGNQDQGS